MAVTDTPLPPVTELREQCTTLGGKIAELRSTPRDKRTAEQNEELRATTIELNSLDALTSVAEKAERAAWAQYAWDAAVKAAEAADERGTPNGPTAANDNPNAGHRTLGDLIVDSDEFKGWERGGERMPNIDLEGRSLGAEFRTLMDTATADAGAFVPPRTPIAPMPRQMRFFLRDLIPTLPTGIANAVPYIRELNPATNESGASSVAEAAAKPEATMEFVEVSAPVRKLAAWLPVTMEILEDAPSLRAYINTRLAYMLQVRETQQILTGNGVSPDLTGILNTSGVQTAGATNNEAFVDIATAIGKIELVDGNADGIVMNPGDYWDQIATRRSSWFDGNASNMGGAPFGGVEGTVWGLPVVRTRAISSLTTLVADWAMGAGIFDRMTTTIRQSDSHDDFFVKNKVAVLAEERLALAVFRPDFFVNTTIDITA